MKKSLLLLFVLTVFFSCKKNNNFHVSGTVKDAAGQLLYIEHNGLLKTTVLDSVKLGDDGKFSFTCERPQYPDFYRLRLNENVITFAVDSCEYISFVSKTNGFSTDYIVKGSQPSVEIQKLRLSLVKIQQHVNELNELSGSARDAKLSEVKAEIEAHKNMAKKMILENPCSTAAYFAIYQQINDTYLFSPYVKEDSPFCKAVATSYNAYMPDYERTKNLYSLVIDAIKTERKAQSKQVWQEVLQKVGKGYIDIDLKDKKNIFHKLSDLEGKLVLIDFSAYEADQSVDYTFELRDLYNKYHSRGFEIYQISLDRNKQLWEQSVENIPWICVRDENGPETKSVASYNVSSVPTTFLLTKQGTIISRSPGFAELDKLIQKNL